MRHKKAILIILLLALSEVTGARAQTLEGVVLVEAATPLAGVTVFLDGTTRGDITDEEGRFNIEAGHPGGYLLVASHLGYMALKQEVLLMHGDTLRLGALVMREEVITLGEVVVKALAEKQWRYLKLFERDVLGQTSVARQGRLVNPEVLTFKRVTGGFRATTSAPLVVVNTATGYHIHVFVERYEHHYRTDGYRFARRLFFEEMGTPSRAQRRLRERLYRGSMRHFLRSWYEGRAAEEGFYVYGTLEKPRRLGQIGYAARGEALLVEYARRPDRAYRALLRRQGAQPPFSARRQVSRISFASGVMRVASNGYAIGPLRQEGYWAFSGVGDAVPAPGTSSK